MKRREFLQLLPPALTQPTEFKLPSFALLVSESRALPQAPGIRFTNVSLDGHWAALLTGRRSPQTRDQTLAEALRSRNYRTAFFGPWRMKDSAPQRGFDRHTLQTKEAAAFLQAHPHQGFACVNGEANVNAHIVWRVSLAKPEFLLQWAGVPIRTVTRQTSILDVFPTLMQYATAPVAPGQVDGESLWLTLTGEC